MPLSKQRVLAIILAGGTGGRMGVLTEGRAKPALPFAGTYRLIDFPLSNCANSEVSDVWVVQQFEPHALEDHLANGRPWDLDRTVGGLILLSPFESGDDERGGWHEGNADALWRYAPLIRDSAPDVVVVLSADAVYAMDYADLVDRHVAAAADVTMATTRVQDEDPGRFGVVQVDDGGRVTGFDYKPDEPEGDLVTMEVFAYRPDALLATLEELADTEDGLEDFGHGLLPRLVADGRAHEHRFEGYWRDVGTPESYWQGHRDLLGDRRLDLDDPAWPVRTGAATRPPAHVAASAAVGDSLLSPGCRVAGRVVGSVLGPGVRVEEGAEVVDAVLMRDTTVEAGARVGRAIVDVGVRVGAGATVGRTEAGSALTTVGAGVEVESGSEVAAGAELAPTRGHPTAGRR